MSLFLIGIWGVNIGKLKIATWNINYGGKIDTIFDHIDKDTNLIILNEFKHNEKGKKIIEELKGYELFCKCLDDKEPKDTRAFYTLIASKIDTNHKVSFLESSDSKDLQNRWVECYFTDINLKVLGIHVPGVFKGRKTAFWKKVIEFAKNNCNEKVIIIGDLNTGLKKDAQGEMFKKWQYFDCLVNKLNWIDVWREKNKDESQYSYFSKRKDGSINGFRIDHAIISSALKNMFPMAYYIPKKGHSDHSILYLTIEL